MDTTTAVTTKPPRDSNIEILRILAIVLIVSMHLLGKVFSTTDFWHREFIIGINAVGNIGVSIFILISGFYGIRYKRNKVLTLINIVLFYSIAIFVIKIFGLHQPLDFKTIATNIFPVSTNKYWFITSYIILTLTSPYINRFIENLTQREYQRLLAIIAVFFVIAPTFLWVEILSDSGKGPINMLFLYLLGRYFALYGFPNIIKHHPKLIMATCFCLIIILNSLITNHFNNGIIMLFARDNNLLIVLEALCCFYAFLQWHFNSKAINYLAKYVFPIYILQSMVLHLFNIREEVFYIDFIKGLFCTIAICIGIELIRRILLTWVFAKAQEIQNKIIDKMV